MSRRKKRAKPAKAGRELVRLKAPAGCAPFKRGGRRYVPSREGFVAVPAGLVDDLLAHGFARLAEDEAKPAPRASKKTSETHHGDG